jgi:succinate dehydrogenase / fumarate reductase, membrane anchor subunit
MADTRNAPHVDMLRSPLGRARGLGSARAGASHWWAQRLTAVALVPLTLWFICGVIRLKNAGQDDVVAWLSAPLPLVLMLALVAATFHHLQLGLQVVIEDYVHDHALRLASVLAMKAACVLLALACIVAVLKLGL